MQDNDFDKLFSQKIKEAPRLDDADASWENITKKLDGNIRRLWWGKAVMYALPMLALVFGNIYFWQKSQQNNAISGIQTIENEVVVFDTIYQNHVVHTYDTVRILNTQNIATEKIINHESRLSQQVSVDKKSLLANVAKDFSIQPSSKLPEQNQEIIDGNIAQKLNQMSGNIVDNENQFVESNILGKTGEFRGTTIAKPFESVDFLAIKMALLDNKIKYVVERPEIAFASPIKVKSKFQMPNMVLSTNIGTTPFLRNSGGRSFGFGADVEVFRHLFVTASADFAKYISKPPPRLNDDDGHILQGNPDHFNHPNLPDTAFVYRDSRLPEFRQQMYGLGAKYVISTRSSFRPYVGLAANIVRTSAHQIVYRFHEKDNHQGGAHGSPRIVFLDEERPATKPNLSQVSATAGLTYMLSNNIGLNGAVTYRQHITPSTSRTDFNSLSFSTGLNLCF